MIGCLCIFQNSQAETTVDETFRGTAGVVYSYGFSNESEVKDSAKFVGGLFGLFIKNLLYVGGELDYFHKLQGWDYGLVYPLTIGLYLNSFGASGATRGGPFFSVLGGGISLHNGDSEINSTLYGWQAGLWIKGFKGSSFFAIENFGVIVGIKHYRFKNPSNIITTFAAGIFF